ncbi:CpxR [Candidatus Thiomargarita nelsonii]|uniref:CpxR n=1 Tax=Candidatus Thiomargarita nelsonii TaxID=1003181 RepID=A0A0A6S244_9GAMM|nr:CpxR [Candidatus Thiomargarita nelsonii]
MYRILLIDDDERLAPLLAEYFSRYDLNLISETHPSQGLRRLSQGDVDLLILDVMLPEMDGFDVCRSLRKDNDMPILMLTARGEVMDRVIGLEIGADDYLAKPFEPRELVARIHNILKRTTSKQTSPIHQFGDLKIDPNRRQVTLKGQMIELTTKEYALLLLLVKSPGKSFSRDEIMNALSGVDAEFFSRSIDILVSRLRQKLKPLENIQTVWGRGYRFIEGAN